MPKRFTLTIILLLNLAITEAQILTIDKCLSGTKNENFSYGFKFKPNDSIRYVVISSQSEDNFFDSINFSHFPEEIPIDYRRTGSWIVSINENTRQTKKAYLGYYYYERPQIIGDEIFLLKTTELMPSNYIYKYAVSIDKDLNFTNYSIYIDSVQLVNGFVPDSLQIGGFFTKDDTSTNLYTYKSNNYTNPGMLHQYKFNENSLISSKETGIKNFYLINNREVKNNKIFQCYDSLLNIFDANANELASFQVLHNKQTISIFYSMTLQDMDDSSVLIKILSTDFSLHVIKINKHDSIDYHLIVPNGNGSTIFLDVNTIDYITDSNLVVPFVSADSSYFVRYDYNGNILHRYAENNTVKVYSKALSYNDSINIIMKVDGGTNDPCFIQKVDNNYTPINSLRLNPNIVYQNKNLKLTYTYERPRLIKTKENRFFIIADYYEQNIDSNFYSVLMEYNVIQNTLEVKSALVTNINSQALYQFRDVFSNEKKETFVIADVNNECVGSQDVVLYKMQMHLSSINDNNILESKILIFPNPAKEQIEVKIKNIKLNNAKVKLMDITGNVIFLSNITQDSLNVDISQLTSGAYLIAIENDQEIQTSKLIIAK